MPLMPVRMRSAWMSPDFCVPGRSIWVTSPVITARESKPMRVRNIFICSRVVFWASSRMMKALFRVRPRMKASGATSITARSASSAARSWPIMSLRASVSGRR